MGPQSDDSAGASSRVIAFDVYGTLVDVHSVTDVCERHYPGHGAELSRLWRQKQLEYSWLVSLMDRYEDFHQLTRRALGFATRSLGLPDPTEAAQVALLDEYAHLRPFPEVPDALTRLSQGRHLFVLSNGAPAIHEELLVNTGLRSRFEAVLSVDSIRRFKPAPTVYRLVVDRTGIPADRAVFVSANGWDVAGARSFGLRVVWVNRTNAHPEEIGPRADWTVPSLDRIADLPLP